MCAYTCICESQSACSASSKLRFFASSSFIMHNGMSSSSIVPAWSMAIFNLRHAECAPNAAAAAIAVASALRRMVVSFCRVGGSVLNEDWALPMTAGLTTSESSLFRSLCRSLRTQSRQSHIFSWLAWLRVYVLPCILSHTAATGNIELSVIVCGMCSVNSSDFTSDTLFSHVTLSTSSFFLISQFSSALFALYTTALLCFVDASHRASQKPFVSLSPQYTATVV